MKYDFKFQLLAADAVKMQPVALGRHYRPLVIFGNGIMLAFGLNYILQGESVPLGLFMVATSLVMLFDRWLLYTPCFAMRNTDACVTLDGQNLTSALGAKSYDIPWNYFLQHGSLHEEDDHFYFKSKLGNIYLPKRAFDGDNEMNKFRNDLSDALGVRCLSAQTTAMRPA